jgi:hypothetical protein
MADIISHQLFHLILRCSHVGGHNEAPPEELNAYTVTAKVYFHLMNFFLFLVYLLFFRIASPLIIIRNIGYMLIA